MKGRKVSVDSRLLVPIASDGALAGPVADGRLIPVLILDTEKRPDVAELLRVHEYVSSGDAQSIWASDRNDDDFVMLLLNFLRPMEVSLVVKFSIEKEAILVEMMLQAGAVYLQAGSPGDRLSATMDNPRVLVQLPETDFAPVWQSLLLKRMTEVMAAKLATSQKRARPVAVMVIEEMGKLAVLRLRPSGGQEQAQREQDG